jgi:hypothetical protein
MFEVTAMAGRRVEKVKITNTMPVLAEDDGG